MYYVELKWYNPGAYSFLVHAETQKKAEQKARGWLYKHDVLDRFDFEPGLVWLEVRELDAGTPVPPGITMVLGKPSLK